MYHRKAAQVLCAILNAMQQLNKSLLGLVIGVALVGAGYTAGRFFTEPIVEVLPGAASTSTVTVRDGSDALALAKALSEVEALKAENAKLRQAAEKPAEVVAQAPDGEQPPPRMNWEERMKALKEADPERYAEIQARRQQFHQMMVEVRTKRANFLDSIDTSLLTPEGLENHTRFTEALARQAELDDQIHAAMDAGERPSDELRLAMRDTWQVLNETRSSERVALLDAIGSSMGLVGQDVEDFRKLVDEVYEATGSGGPPQGMMLRSPGAPPPER